MTHAYTTGANTSRLALALLSRDAPLDWRDWLPLATEAAHAPEQWALAFRTLTLERQFDLINLFCQPDAGPLADALMGLLASYIDDTLDENIRQLLLNADEETQDRHGARLRVLKDRYEILNSTLAANRQRLSPEFDLGLEIARLQGDLARSRQQEFVQNERFTRIHSLEAELLRYETRRRILERYDLAGREAHLTELRAEIDAQEMRKRELETSISQTIGHRDTVRREAEMQRAQLETLTADLTAQEQALARAQAGSAATLNAIAQNEAEWQRLRDELVGIAAEQARLDENNRQLTALAQTHRAKLEELRAASAQAGAQEVSAKIAEVYALLPRDGADPGFAPTGGNSS